MTKDSNGVEIKPGDIVECPEVSEKHALRYHICYKDSICEDDEPKIRDLGHNNLYIFDCSGPYYNIGHFSKHLDKLDNEDLKYYFSINIELLKANRCVVKIEEEK